MSDEMNNSQVQICPQCDNHCPIDALRCGKGRKFFGVEGEDQERGHDHDHDYGHAHHHHGHEGRHHHKHEGHRK